MSNKPRGLEASIWANAIASRQNHYHHRRRTGDDYQQWPPHESRPRSVPPESSRHPPSLNGATAPPPSSTSAAAAAASRLNHLAPAQAFQRFEQACQRLRWKYIDLETSYRRALNPAEAGFARADAERNFKVDFHEFYVWIEQALVLVMRVYGVTVSRGGPMTGSGSASNGANHAYHHNVLRALEDEENPLREVLGQGERNQALWKAKELRNRWKDAAEGREETPPLKMYDLTWIVSQILGGLEIAYHLARVRVDEEQSLAELRKAQSDGTNGNDNEGTARDAMAVDEGWEWMVEPMDWES